MIVLSNDLLLRQQTEQTGRHLNIFIYVDVIEGSDITTGSGAGGGGSGANGRIWLMRVDLSSQILLVLLHRVLILCLTSQ